MSLLADYSADPAGPRSWRYVRDRAGSGALGDLLSHGVDLAQLIAGSIAGVCALTKTVIIERPAPAEGAATHFDSAGTQKLLPVEKRRPRGRPRSVRVESDRHARGEPGRGGIPLRLRGRSSGHPGIDPAGEDHPVGFESLSDDGEAEAIKPSEGGQVGPAEAGVRGSVGHVEVFQMVSMRTSIFGRPRLLPRDRRASRAIA